MDDIARSKLCDVATLAACYIILLYLHEMYIFNNILYYILVYYIIKAYLILPVTHSTNYFTANRGREIKLPECMAKRPRSDPDGLHNMYLYAFQNISGNIAWMDMRYLKFSSCNRILQKAQQ